MKKLTELVFLLDRSGSMHGLEDDVVGGFNAMLEKQKKEPGDALVTAVFFSDEAETVLDRAPLKDARPLTPQDYCPGGRTALLDAVGEAVRRIDAIHRCERGEGEPVRTVFVIMTDGMENASRRYTACQVRQMVCQKQAGGWEFLFLGAGLDVAETAEALGVRPDRAARYRCDAQGIRRNYEAVGRALYTLRSSEALDAHWKDEIEAGL